MAEAFPFEQYKLRNGELAFRKFPEVQFQFKRGGVIATTTTAACNFVRINELEVLSLGSRQKCRVMSPWLVNVVVAVPCMGVSHHLLQAQVHDAPSVPLENYCWAAHRVNPRHGYKINRPEPMLRFPDGFF